MYGFGLAWPGLLAWSNRCVGKFECVLLVLCNVWGFGLVWSGSVCVSGCLFVFVVWRGLSVCLLVLVWCALVWCVCLFVKGGCLLGLVWFGLVWFGFGVGFVFSVCGMWLFGLSGGVLACVLVWCGFIWRGLVRFGVLMCGLSACLYVCFGLVLVWFGWV